MKLLAFLLRRSPGLLAVAILAGALSGAASSFLLAVVHSSLEGAGRAARPSLVWGFVGLCLLAPAARVSSQHLLTRLVYRTVRELRVELNRRILATPLRRIEELGSHRLLAALTTDIAVIANGLVQIPVLTVTVSLVLGCLAYLTWLSGTLFLAMLGILAVGVVSYQALMVSGVRHFRRSREEQDVLYGLFRSLTEGIQELQLHRGRTRGFSALVEECSRLLERLHVAAMLRFNVAGSWGHLLFFVVIGVLLFALPGWRVVDGSIVVGYVVTLLYMMSPLQAALDAVPALSQTRVALEKIERLGLNLAEARRLAEDEPAAALGAPPAAGWQRLELAGVTYTHSRQGSERPFVLGPLDLTFRPGELVFVVGGNGSGKTTFAKLLTGLYAPESGEIRLDGVPVGDGGRDDYRQRFAAVFAHPHLFGVLLGLDRPDLDERARDYLDELGLAGRLDVSGGKLSTTALSDGQRKRVALVTAYLEDRPIYVFDEWAANQDPLFRDTFYSRIVPDLKAQGKMVLVISHDDRYFQLADRILKLHDGRVESDGSYADYSRRLAAV